MQTVNIYNKRRPVGQGYVNNQITDWSFRVDGILQNVSQDTVYDKVVKDITLKTLDGYNGAHFFFIFFFVDHNHKQSVV